MYALRPALTAVKACSSEHETGNDTAKSEISIDSH